VGQNLQSRFVRQAEKGEVLFREGESGSQMFVLQSGKVRLTRMVRGEEQFLADLGPGEFFGEMSILNDKPRSATAVVLEDAQLLALDSKTFEAMIRTNTEIAVRMIKKIAGRLDAANERIENLLLRDSNSRVVHTVLLSARAQGRPVEGGVLVALSAADIQQHTGIEPTRVEEVLSRMERSGLVKRQGAQLLAPSLTRLDEFLYFLEMRERAGEA
jgi:CRP/FNR family transcriptional regulator, cyclic AMP receptor protein